ncbi:hypothetical protein DPMN_112584 [Dreissena polymorpha]|uniref:Uncharacterized protein n=1 Tax=Dreissena polymorpha TaxID=45954 RepID=A0A9D4QR15_DREPO|nr:hypothetical protein DPMN_112584 [Dreissena polymorpha]
MSLTLNKICSGIYFTNKCRLRRPRGRKLTGKFKKRERERERGEEREIEREREKREERERESWGEGKERCRLQAGRQQSGEWSECVRDGAGMEWREGGSDAVWVDVAVLACFRSFFLEFFFLSSRSFLLFPLSASPPSPLSLSSFSLSSPSLLSLSFSLALSRALLSPLSLLFSLALARERMAGR